MLKTQTKKHTITKVYTNTHQCINTIRQKNENTQSYKFPHTNTYRNKEKCRDKHTNKQKPFRIEENIYTNKPRRKKNVHTIKQKNQI